MIFFMQLNRLEMVICYYQVKTSNFNNTFYSLITPLPIPTLNNTQYI